MNPCDLVVLKLTGREKNHTSIKFNVSKGATRT